jgi:hypothetical protein
VCIQKLVGYYGAFEAEAAVVMGAAAVVGAAAVNGAALTGVALPLVLVVAAGGAAADDGRGELLEPRGLAGSEVVTATEAPLVLDDPVTATAVALVLDDPTTALGAADPVTGALATVMVAGDEAPLGKGPAAPAVDVVPEADAVEWADADPPDFVPDSDADRDPLAPVPDDSAADPVEDDTVPEPVLDAPEAPEASVDFVTDALVVESRFRHVSVAMAAFSLASLYGHVMPLPVIVMVVTKTSAPGSLRVTVVVTLVADSVASFPTAQT